MIKVTYQKSDGKIVEKYRQVYTSHRIGETTCWGWKVLDIKYSYNDKYYSSFDLDRLIDKKVNLHRKINTLKKKIYKIYMQTGYMIILFLFIKYIKEIL